MDNTRHLDVNNDLLYFHIIDIYFHIIDIYFHIISYQRFIPIIYYFHIIDTYFHILIPIFI